MGHDVVQFGRALGSVDGRGVCTVWAKGLLGATGQPIGSRDPRAVRSRWEGDSGAGGIVNVTVTVATVSAGASDRKVCEAKTKASSCAVLVPSVVTRHHGHDLDTHLAQRHGGPNEHPATATFRTSQRGDRDCQSAAARVPRWDCSGRSQLGGPGCNSWSHHYLCCGGELEGLLSRSIPTATTTGTSPACPTTAFKWSNLNG